jgi:prepilin-type N-terminal cleavage/methylation domain-containing protein
MMTTRAFSRAADCRSRKANQDDRGFTLVELLVTMLILSIVMSISTTLIIAVGQQTTNITDTVQGIQQEGSASAGLIQYLRGASQVLPVYNSAGTQIGPSATQLDVVAAEGFNINSSTNNYGATFPDQSNCTNIDAVWYASSTKVAAQFDISFDVPSSGPPQQLPWSALTATDGAAPYTYSPASPCAPPTSGTPDADVRTLADYQALSTQVDPVFTYWTFQPGSTTTSTTLATPNIPPGLVQLPTAGSPGVIPVCALDRVAAIGIHVTFLAGPQKATGGYSTDEPTTLNALVYLRGSSTSGATTTSSSTTTSTTTCPE